MDLRSTQILTSEDYFLEPICILPFGLIILLYGKDAP